MDLSVYKDDNARLLPYSDKVLLPPVMLRTLLDDFGENASLPHPLIFTVSSSDDPLLSVHVGVKEFTSPTDTSIVLPSYVAGRLGNPLRVHVKLDGKVPQAHSLSLLPSHVYANITSYKFFLESILPRGYTTLTVGQNIVLEHDGLRYELRVQSINGLDSGTASIVDTDIALDIAPLLDDMANETLRARDTNPLNNIVALGQSASLSVPPAFLGGSNSRYRIDAGAYMTGLDIIIESQDIHNVDIVVGSDPFVESSRFQYSSLDQDRQGMHDHGNKTVCISAAELAEHARIQVHDEDEVGGPFLYVLAIAWQQEAEMSIKVIASAASFEKQAEIPATAAEIAICDHCGVSIPTSLIFLHRETCAKHTVKCECGATFRKTIPQDHWHCPQCTFICTLLIARQKHLNLYHRNPYTCDECGTDAGEYASVVALAQNHRASDCIHRPHQCRFCMLVVPCGPNPPSHGITGYLGHEHECGNRTEECSECGRPVRRRELASHMQMHQHAKADRESNMRRTLALCSNVQCSRLVPKAQTELGLCEGCFAPLYVPQHDPTGKALMRRLERRYILQMQRGCKQAWCTNPYCGLSQNAHPYIRTESFAALIEVWKRELDPTRNDAEIAVIAESGPHSNGSDSAVISHKNQYFFCVTESIAQSRKLLDDLAQTQTEPDPILNAYYSNNMAKSFGSLIST